MMKSSNSWVQRSVAGFITCFLGASLTFFLFVIYSHSNEVHDNTVDWDVLLSNMAAVEFCASDTAVVAPSTPRSRVEANLTSTANSLALPPRNFSVTMMLTVIPSKELADIPHNITYVHGRLYGYQLGLQEHLELEEVNVTFDIPVTLHRCGRGHCQKSSVITCIHLQAAPHVLPTSRAPAECQRVNESEVEYHTDMLTQHNLLQTSGGGQCRGSTIKLRRTSTPSLSLLLSVRDRSVGSLHLLHTSFFVFIMAIMLIASSLLCGKRHVLHSYTHLPQPSTT